MSNTRLSLFLFFSLLLLIRSSSSPSGDRRNILAYNPAMKRDGRRRDGGEPVPDCRAIGSRAECARSSRWCRWCRSEALDDMCFSSAEAWRLPHQVFSCDSPSAS